MIAPTTWTTSAVASAIAPTSTSAAAEAGSRPWDAASARQPAPAAIPETAIAPAARPTVETRRLAAGCTATTTTVEISAAAPTIARGARVCSTTHSGSANSVIMNCRLVTA